MKSEEIDEIIAQAVAESKGKKSTGKPRQKRGGDTIDTVRRILNYIFIIGFVVTIALYFLFPENKTLFFCVGFGALGLKIVEFLLRFLF